MDKLRYFILLISVAVITGLTNTVALAQGSQAVQEVTNNCNNGSAFCVGYNSGQTQDPTQKILRAVTDLLAFIAGILAVIYAIYGGFKYITSAGNAEKASSGRQTLLYALVGIVVVIVSRQLIQAIIGRL